MAADRCDWPACKQEALLGWLGRDVCQLHWTAVCRLDDEGKIQEAYDKLKVQASYRRGAEPMKLDPEPEVRPQSDPKEDLLDFDDLDVPKLEDD